MTFRAHRMWRSSVFWGVVFLGFVSGCGSRAGFEVGPELDAEGRAPMDRSAAKQYVLSLVNQDRAEHALPPVVWDAVAERAGQGHADDMASHGFTAHLGTNGSVPELRHTLAGGFGMVMENVGCFADGRTRELDPNPMFTVASLEKLQKAFMDEVPTFDGHRRNILTPWHTSFGAGLAKAKELDVACMAQEFIDDYGEYDALPAQSPVAATIEVRGTLREPAQVGGIGVARIDHPIPIPPKALNKTGSYRVPKPYQTFFPKGYKTPIPLDVSGQAFSIEIPLSDRDLPGLYEISVWARLPQSDELLMVSLRTIDVR